MRKLFTMSSHANYGNFLFVFITAMLLLSSNGIKAQGCSACGPNGWEYLVEIPVDNSSNPSTLTDYQVLVYVDTQTPIAQGKMDSTGADIRFTSNCDTLLNYWIEGPMDDDSTKIWVKVPSITANAVDTIFMNYGNPLASPMSSIPNTFINTIDSVRASWHMDEVVGNFAYETSGNGLDGEIFGNISFSTTAQRGASSLQTPVGVAADRLQIGGFGDLTRLDHQGSYSFLAWVNVVNNAGGGLIVGFGDCCSPRNGYTMNLRADGTAHFWGGSDVNTSNYNTYSSTPIDDGNWHLCVMRVSTGTGVQIMIDGVLDGTNTSNIPTSASDNFTFGHVPFAPQIGGDGVSIANNADILIDEVQVYADYLTDLQIADIYNNHAYTTTNYPGVALIRKYNAPEPMTSNGVELANTLLSDSMSIVDADCIPDSGQATATATGTNPPFTYQWGAGTGNQTTATATGLGGGTYFVTITDTAGCVVVDSATIVQFPVVTATISVNDAATTVSCDGDATANPTSGTPPYSFQWDDPNLQTTQTATALCSGHYQVVVTDSNGCSWSDLDVVVGPTTGITNILFEESIQVFPNPNTGEFVIEMNVPGTQDVEIRIVNMLGQEVFTKQLGNISGTYREQVGLKKQPSGVYRLQIMANDHTVDKQLVIE